MRVRACVCACVRGVFVIPLSVIVLGWGTKATGQILQEIKLIMQPVIINGFGIYYMLNAGAAQ